MSDAELKNEPVTDDETPADDVTPDDVVDDEAAHETDTTTNDVDEAAPKRRGRKPKNTAAEGSAAEEPTAKPGPEPGHPLAPPAQQEWEDAWGLLPAQMRHTIDGVPVG